MATINLKGREIPLLFTTLEMKEIQEQIAPMAKAIDMALGRNKENPEDKSGFGSAEQLDTAAKMIVILGNAGLEENGEKPDLTYRKVMRSMNPVEVPGAVTACMEAISEGMESEHPGKEHKGPVDVTLEEIEKKKETTSSPT